MTKNDRLGVRSILYFINYKMVIVVLCIERKALFFIRTEREKCCRWLCATYTFMLILLSLEMLFGMRNESHTQMASCELIP